MIDTTRWTLVTLDPRGRFFRPMADAPVGTWRSVAALTGTCRHIPDSVQVWHVPCEGEAQHEEDRDNVLVSATRRVPIRWDAAPKHAFRP